MNLNEIFDELISEAEKTYKQTEEEKIRMLIRNYLVHSFLYYELNSPIIPDEQYDKICRELLKYYDKIKKGNFKYKELIDKEALKAGSAYHLRIKDYPTEIADKALKLQRLFAGEQ